MGTEVFAMVAAVVGTIFMYVAIYLGRPWGVLACGLNAIAFCIMGLISLAGHGG